MTAEDGNDPPTLQDHGPRTGEIEDPTKTLEGYTFGEVIGRGGIGEVVAAHDLRIGRDVAIKRLKQRNPKDAETTRFLREARIQARLDHPAIPAVHELGRDPEGRPYFTMKRLVGITLGELLAAPEPPRQRLLRAFTEVCNAIDFAHERGVVHRDLKPANVMLGNYGDVYVLDWGLARMVGEAVANVVTDDIDSLDLNTGELLGTPGYMAPEQLHRAAEAGRPADIYALGSMLFEILAGEPLHPRGANAMPSTVSGTTVTSPARRRPDRSVPPELDAICVGMLAMEPASRPTARRVAERVQAYLDGDRDVARRRTMALDLVWSSRAMLEDNRRGEAMSAAGRALALDPESPGAAEIVTTLMLQPPATPPPELEVALRQADVDGVRRHARIAIFAYLAIASFLPLAMWNGIRRWDTILEIFALAIAMATSAWLVSRHPERSLASMMLYAFGNAVLIGLLTRLAGPFTFVPGLTCVIVMSVMAYPVFTVHSWVLVATLIAGWIAPIVLELEGVLSTTWDIRDGALISHAGALEVQGTPTLVLLIVASLAMILVAGVDSSRIYRASRDARLQLVSQTWHLRQLLPAASRAATLS